MAWLIFFAGMTSQAVRSIIGLMSKETPHLLTQLIDCDLHALLEQSIRIAAHPARAQSVSIMAVSDFLSTLTKWLPYTLHASIFADSKDALDPTNSPLLQDHRDRPLLVALAGNPDVKPVLGASRMLSKDSTLPSDHLVR
jgi:hypothetical protein